MAVYYPAMSFFFDVKNGRRMAINETRRSRMQYSESCRGIQWQMAYTKSDEENNVIDLTLHCQTRRVYHGPPARTVTASYTIWLLDRHGVTHSFAHHVPFLFNLTGRAFAFRYCLHDVRRYIDLNDSSLRFKFDVVYYALDNKHFMLYLSPFPFGTPLNVPQVPQEEQQTAAAGNENVM